MAESELQGWTTNSSEYLINDRWLKLRADSCTTPDGHTVEPFYIFEYSDWANCWVIDDNNDVILINQYRHGAGKYVMEFVGGGIEPEDPTPEAGIRRELEEEIGYVGGEIYQVGTSYPNPASHTNKLHSFLAVGGSCSQKQRLEKGENLHIHKIPVGEFIKSLQDNEPGLIDQSLHLATLFMAQNFIKRSQLPEIKQLKKFL